jgi:hypothetical protein
MHGNAKKGLDDNLPYQLVAGFFLQICSKGGFSRKLTCFYSRWAWFSCYNTSIGTSSTLPAHISYAL